MSALKVVLLLGLLAVQAAAQSAPKPPAAAAAPKPASKKPSVTAADISDCQKIITALNLKYEGNTVLCPVNKAIAKYADSVGYSSVDALLKDIADPDSEGRKAVTRVFKDHIIQGFAPRKAIKPGGYETLLSPSERESTIVLAVEVNGDVKITSEYAKDLIVVAGADLTFDGPFDGSTTYVVHAIPAVLVPGGGKVAPDPAGAATAKAGDSPKTAPARSLADGPDQKQADASKGARRLLFL